MIERNEVKHTTPDVTTQKPKKLRPLTTKQLKFVKAKAEGKTGVEAAREAYNLTDYNTANVIASQNLHKLNIQEAVQAEMAKQGITLEAIIKPIADGLVAEKVAIVGNGEQAMADIQPDHSIRLKSSSMAAQFMGIGKNNDGGTTMNFINIAGDHKDKYGI